MVFVFRQLQEKCREQNKGLYVSFVDLTKAFDTVSRKGMWQIMERLGCPPRVLNMVIQLHDDQRGQVRLNGDLSEPFAISNGVKQGCVLAPTLFSIFFSMMLRQATEDLNDDDSIYIRYRLDGNLFNLRRLQAHTKTQEQLIRDLLFADDAALVAHTERALQRFTSCFAEAAQLFGLEISLKKTEVLHQPAPQEEYHPPHISIDETELNTVHKFAYLGCIISSDAKIDKEIDNRLASHSAGSSGWLAQKTGAGPTFQWAGNVDAICRSRSNRAKRPRAGCILRSLPFLANWGRETVGCHMIRVLDSAGSTLVEWGRQQQQQQQTG